MKTKSLSTQAQRLDVPNSIPNAAKVATTVTNKTSTFHNKQRPNSNKR